MLKRLNFLVAIFIVFVIFSSCKSKKNNIEKKINYIPYYLKMYEADSLYLVDDFEGSYKILDSLFKVYEPLNNDNYGEYGIYLNCAVKTKHLDKLNEKVRYGYLHFGNLQTLHKDSYNMEMAVNKAANIEESEIKELKNVYYNSLNLEIRKRLLKIFDDDQKVRKEKKSNEIISETDSKSLNELDDIFKNFGFPKKNIIGWNNAYDTPDKGRIDFNIIIAHQSDEIKKRFLPIFLNAIKNGSSEPWTYAFIYDRMMMDNYKKQMYGTFNCNDGKPCEFINPKKIDSIRKSIGLPHIKYYDWRVKQFEED